MYIVYATKNDLSEIDIKKEEEEERKAYSGLVNQNQW